MLTFNPILKMRKTGFRYISVSNTMNLTTTVISNHTTYILHKILVYITAIQFSQGMDVLLVT
ncbi:Uncharacterised protein [Klebsiella pneumoniae]|nr:Uncharacterised protein [Klebsiella pneumoniae]